MTISLLLNSHIALWAFDFDGNILAPDTITYVIERESGEEVGVPAHTLDQNPELISGENAKYRWKEDIIDSLINFRDYHSSEKHGWPDQLKEDIEKALGKNAFSPSLESLKDIFLIPARICAIITARGHGPDNLARILWIINEYLLSPEEKEEQENNISELFRAFWRVSKWTPTRDRLLRFYFEEIVSYYPVSNPHIAKYLSMNYEKSMAKRKTIAMAHFIEDTQTRIIPMLKMENIPLSLGFSDDSLSNIIAMTEYFESKRKSWYPKQNKIHVYFTWKKESFRLEKTQKRKIKEEKNMMIIEL